MKIIDLSMRGDVAALAKALEDGGAEEIDFSDARGLAAIHYACTSGNLEVLQLLISHGANLNLLSYDGCSPAHFAAHNDNVEVLNILKKSGANLDLPDFEKATPLIFAVVENKLLATKFLLEQNEVNVNTQDITGSSALMWSVSNGYNRISEEIISCPRLEIERHKYPKTKITPLMIAAWNNQISIVEKLIPLTIDIREKNIYGHNAFSTAIFKNNFAIAELLYYESIRAEDDSTKDDSSIDSEYKNTMLEELLLSELPEKIFPDIKLFCTNFQVQCLNNRKYWELIYFTEELLEVSSILYTNPIIIACNFDNIDFLDFCITNSEDLSFKTDKGLTPLMHSINMKSPNVIKKLLSSGVDIEEQDFLGNRAISYAIKKGDFNTIKLLCSLGAKLDFLNNDREMCFSFAKSYHILDRIENEIPESAIHVRNFKEISERAWQTWGVISESIPTPISNRADTEEAELASKCSSRDPVEIVDFTDLDRGNPSTQAAPSESRAAASGPSSASRNEIASARLGALEEALEFWDISQERSPTLPLAPEDVVYPPQHIRNAAGLAAEPEI